MSTRTDENPEIKFFNELPPKRPTGGVRPRSQRIDNIVAKLKAEPGLWSPVERDVNPGIVTSYRNRGCEVATRENRLVDGSPRCVIWARWPVANNDK